MAGAGPPVAERRPETRRAARLGLGAGSAFLPRGRMRHGGPPRATESRENKNGARVGLRNLVPGLGGSTGDAPRVPRTGSHAA